MAAIIRGETALRAKACDLHQKQVASELARRAAQMLNEEAREMGRGTETQLIGQLRQHDIRRTQSAQRIGDALFINYMLGRDTDATLELTEKMRSRHTGTRRQAFDFDARNRSDAQV